MAHPPYTTIAGQTPTTMSPLLKLMLDQKRYYPIYESFMSHLEATDIVRLGRLSNELSNVYQDAIETQWSINSHLKRFFAHPVQFRNVQAATGALITKHVALGFFERRIIRSSEEGVDLAMCIVVEQGPNAEAIEGFLKEEGYSQAVDAESENDDEKQEALEERSIVQISTFTKCKGGSANQRIKISVEHCETIPEHGFAEGLRLTSMANVISWNKAYCLFPVALKTKITYLMAQMPEETKALYVDFRQEVQGFGDGFTLKSAAWYKLLEADSQECCELGPIRQFGDRFSWIIDLDVKEVQPPKQGLAPLDFATLNFQVPKNMQHPIPPGVAPFLKSSSWVAEAVILRHRYLLTEPPGQEGIYPQNYSEDLTPKNRRARHRHWDLISALKGAALLQLNMLEPANRPANFREVANMTEDLSSDANFTAPPGWSYHDEAVLSYLSFVRKHIESRSK